MILIECLLSLECAVCAGLEFAKRYPIHTHKTTIYGLNIMRPLLKLGEGDDIERCKSFCTEAQIEFVF